MWYYWTLFLMPAAAAYASSVRVHADRTGAAISMWLLLTLIIGLRHEVGADWLNYFGYLFWVTDLDFSEVLALKDPGFQVLNWISVYLGWGIYGVNLGGGAIFTSGLLSLCLRQPRFWLALAVAIPYLVIVVAMGYTRQAIALGFVMGALAGVGKASPLRFVVLVSIAVTFHKSAVLMLPIGALAAAKNKFLTGAGVAVVSAVLYWLMLAGDVDNLYENYVVAEYQSQGALVRLVMNAVPAVIFLTYRQRFGFNAVQARLWAWFSIFSLALLALLFVSSASTAIDRVALYLLPLQVVVFAHLPDVFGTRGQPSAAVGSVRYRSGTDDRDIVVTAVLIYYFLVQFVWLNFADHSFAWIPYRFYLLEAGQ